jgi:hypothetical protein
MHIGSGVSERRLILELGGFIVVGISMFSLGHIWVKLQSSNADNRQRLIRRLVDDPGGAIRKQKQNLQDETTLSLK